MSADLAGLLLECATNPEWYDQVRPVLLDWMEERQDWREPDVRRLGRTALLLVPARPRPSAATLCTDDHEATVLLQHSLGVEVYTRWLTCWPDPSAGGMGYVDPDPRTWVRRLDGALRWRVWWRPVGRPGNLQFVYTEPDDRVLSEPRPFEAVVVGTSDDVREAVGTRVELLRLFEDVVPPDLLPPDLLG